MKFLSNVFVLIFCVVSVHAQVRRPHICQQPPETGLCRARIPSWFYNPQTGSCDVFIYGGCGGNQNRFDTKEMCEARCQPQRPRPTICQQPRDPGLCRAYIPSWFHNPLTGSCEVFIYGGCGGNQNRFDTQQECEATCLPQMGRPNACQQLPETGVCRARMPRWFYDFRSRSCKIFIYGGCGGNENQFPTEEACQATCLPTHRRKIVCSQDPNPRQCYWGSRWYFNSSLDTCQQLPLGQCSSTANRFPTCVQCMSRCTKFNARESCREILRALPGPGQPE
ncbi:carboxypeptidase inhibitor SmCI-like isoform X4 [Dermacentor silvarum]|uniref:carboxypeptidase inhibitor SmCI-like isoform X4 n=1 Tax=Dermacentor silvarum TaxID=543639 RepID=UPI002101C490|nr:carboxypeptidase inhibitor SmCI-like isoform X4 [Dermacentor silvarum]